MAPHRRIFATLRTNRHVVKQLDASSMPAVYDSYFGTYMTPGSGSSALNFPCGITTDGDHNIFVCDFENQRIVKLDSGMNYVGALDTSGTIGKPCAIMLDGSSLYFTGVRYHSINNNDMYMYVGVQKCTTTFTGIKYSNDLIGINGRLGWDKLIYKPNSICQGFLSDEILVSGIGNSILSTIESPISFSLATSKIITGKGLPFVFRGMTLHSDGNLYLNSGSRILRVNSSYVNVGESNILSNTLYGIKEDFDRNLLVYDVRNKKLIAVDHDLNFVQDVYVDTGDTVNDSFYDVFDITADIY